MRLTNILILYLTASVLFAYLFFNSEAGVNFLAFFGIALATVLSSTHSVNRQDLWIPGLTASLFALSTTLYGGGPAQAFFWLAWIAVPITAQKGLISAPVAFAQGALSHILLPFNFYMTASDFLPNTRASGLRTGLLTAAAIAAFLLFAVLYVNTSEVMQQGLLFLLDGIDLSFLGMFLIGLVLFGAVFVRSHILPLYKLENYISVLNVHLPDPAHENDTKYESLLARRLIIGLIVLALAPSVLDGATLAGLLPMNPELVLADELHKSVFMLILSCGLIGCLAGLIFDRTKKPAHELHRLFFLFLLGNVGLVALVAIKNGIYIDKMGLTFKRIGVLAWLVLVVAGLAITYLKVSRAHSFYWLARAASWAAFLTFASFLTLPTNYWVRISQMSRRNPDIVYLAENLSSAELMQFARSAEFTRYESEAQALSKRKTLTKVEQKLVEAVGGIRRSRVDAPLHWQSWNLSRYLAWR